MKYDFEKKFESLSKVHMTHADKVRMRNALHLHMLANPVRISLTTRLYNSLSEVRHTFSGFSEGPSFLLNPAFSMAALFVCVVLGTSYAAESALPGETLYSVKTRVNEPLQGVFAVSDVSKIEWSGQLVERRLLEAESLAASGKLTALTQATIESGFESASKNLDAQVLQLNSSRSKKGRESAEVHVENSIIAHESVLAAIGASSSSTDEQLQPLITMVRSRNKNRSGRHDSGESIATVAVVQQAANIQATSKRKKAQKNDHAISRSNSDVVSEKKSGYEGENRSDTSRPELFSALLATTTENPQALTSLVEMATSSATTTESSTSDSNSGHSSDDSNSMGSSGSGGSGSGKGSDH